MLSVSSNDGKINIYSQEILISREEISQRVEELGRQISTDYQGSELHLVGVLNGAFIFWRILCVNSIFPAKSVFCRLLVTKNKRLVRVK